jgi:hypothetical protein
MQDNDGGRECTFLSFLDLLVALCQSFLLRVLECVSATVVEGGDVDSDRQGRRRERDSLVDKVLVGEDDHVDSDHVEVVWESASASPPSCCSHPT